MEKQLAVAGYWLGVLSAVLALLLRLFSAVNAAGPHLGAAGGNAISYLTFFHGAELFLLLGIASSLRAKT